MPWLVLLLLIPKLSLAFTATTEKNCGALDLRDEVLGEVRNQKKISWCYAFTSADMLGHAFQTSEKISAADVALNYNQTQLGRFMRWLSLNVLNPNDPELKRMAHQTGFSQIAMKKIMQEGWCPERIFPSEAWTKVTPDEVKEVPLHQAMLEIAGLFEKRQQLNLQNLPFFFQFHQVDKASFLKLLKQKSLADFYAGLKQTVCQGERRAFNQKYQVSFIPKNPGIFKQLAKRLERGEVVALDYDSRILSQAQHRGVKISELHTSAIVGRRWNPNAKRCELLLRNSWGSSCSTRYDPSLACESGHIWLGEEQIYGSMVSAVLLTP